MSDSWEDQIIDDALCALDDLIKKSKNMDDPNVAEYQAVLDRVMLSRFLMHRPMYVNLPNKPGRYSNFTCAWCKERITGEDMQKHINQCAKVSPEHPANMVKALKGIINDC